MQTNRSLPVFFLVILLVSCGNPESKPSQDIDANIVSFKGREIDLSPFVEGFPYSNFNPVYAAGKLYYMKRGKTTDLLQIDLSGDADLEKGQ